MKDLVLAIPGAIPVPQGSKKAHAVYRGRGADRQFTGRVNVVDEQGPKLKAWRELIIAEAYRALGRGAPLLGPVDVLMSLALPRPGYHFGTGRNAGVLKPRYVDTAPASKPDVDKLARAVLDALTLAGVYLDDAQVVMLAARKVYANPAPAGALIVIRPYVPDRRVEATPPADVP